jgi:phage gpG-like protein
MSRYKGGSGRAQKSAARKAAKHEAFIGMGEVRFKQKIETDPGKALALMSSLAVGFVKKRTDSGKDIAGNPFEVYSESYDKARTKGGYGPWVKLSLTGGMVNSITEISRAVTSNGGKVRIGPGTGTSPQVYFTKGGAKRSGKRGPAHNIVGAYLHFGTAKMPARKFLGLTHRERGKISKALTAQSAKVLKEKRTGR